MTELTIEDQVKQALEEIRPNLQADGGDIEFLGLDNNRVKVRLTGACGTCPSAVFTLKMGVEAHIKKKVPEIEGIISY